MEQSSVQSVIASAVALTTTLTASTKTVKSRNADKFRIQVDWTPGTSGNVLTFAVDTRTKDGQWTQEMSWGNSPGTRTRTLEQYQHTASGTTLVPLFLNFEAVCDELRVRYAESEAGSATKGTVSVTVLSNKA